MAASEVLPHRDGDRTTCYERRRYLLARARAEGHVAVTGAANELHMSVETVRRDLRVLEAHGLVRREYGVAYPVETAGFESDLASRESEWLPEKRRIAAEAVLHIDDAETIFIDEGYLPQLVAQQLPTETDLTVVTASLPVASMLALRPSVSVVVLGGRLRGVTLATVDHWATEMLSEFVIDLAFMGANGISRTHGLTTPDPAVAAVKSAAVRASRRRIFIGAHLKFSAVSFARFAEVADFETLITDTRLSLSEAHRYMQLGPTVVRV
ncbi:MAG TPA: DeoR/GlpR family DNA-binding transcription regulator [Gaiellaceae bacterium]|nr:DeoR/GlpR family DNA-binding transcription regulator [Gaiellaceae bacterium]